MPVPVATPAQGARGEPERAGPTNLPVVVRRLIGRDVQLDSITELLGDVRLLSLVGPGGAGKTSLALAAAVRVASNYPEGAFAVRRSPTWRSRRCTWVTTTPQGGCSTTQPPRPVRSVTVPGRYSPDTGTASSPTSTGHWDQARRQYAIAVDGFIDLGTPVLEGVALAGWGGATKPTATPPPPKPGTRKRCNWAAGSANRA